MSLKQTSCILCSQNCGLLIEQDEDGNFIKIQGDKNHPISKGYFCQKATRLNYYQKQQRLDSPLRKKEDGSFEQISWDVAIQEIADKLTHIRNTTGGKTIAYIGGGGQGNHVGGIFGSTLRAACDTPYIYSALAQEKTGNFWVNGHLFGKQNTNYTEPIAEAEYVMILGANPMQSHGFPRAKLVLKEVSENPNKKLVVIDPRFTETAKKADLFLQIKPGTDAYFLSAIIATIVQNNLENKTFIATRTVGFDKIKPHFQKIDPIKYAKICEIEPQQIEQLAHEICTAKTFALRSDLGIEQSFNSTLNAYLVRLLFLITGHFGKQGTNNLHTMLLPLIGHSKEPENGGETTQVTKMKGIGKLYPPNILPQEIESDHPNRLRAAIVDSSNPVANYADSTAQQRALAKLDLLVVLDVAMTETAKLAHYVLPTQSQFEKFEATFFNIEFPENFFHLRHPIAKPLENTLPEPEIYHRIVAAMGEIPLSFPFLKTIAKIDRKLPALKLFPTALALTLSLKPKWKKYALLVLKESLGKALPYENAEATVLIWSAAHIYAKKYERQVQRAGFTEKGYALGEALFNKIINSKSGTIISKHTFDESQELIRHKDKKIHLNIPEMLQWLDNLAKTNAHEKRNPEYPFLLMAGERIAYNATAIMRNPDWRKSEEIQQLKMNTADAQKHHIQNNDWIKCSSQNASVKVRVLVTNDIPTGVLSLPHGYGLEYPNASPEKKGIIVNMLTSLDYCDPLAKTPYHKNVCVKIEKLN